MPVYFIQAGGGDGLIKIGYAKNVVRRLSQMQADSSLRLTILGIAVGNRAQEMAFHREFANDRSHGEWFRPSLGLLRLVGGLRPFERAPVKRRYRISHDDPLLAKLLERAGGLGQLARCGAVDHSTASGWLRVGKIPVGRARKIHEALKIPLHEIRPDIWRPAEAAA